MGFAAKLKLIGYSWSSGNFELSFKEIICILNCHVEHHGEQRIKFKQTQINIKWI